MIPALLLAIYGAYSLAIYLIYLTLGAIMDAELIRTIAEYVGYAAMAAAVIPHPNAKTAGVVLKGLRTILDLMAANTGQAKNAENPIVIKDAPKVIKDAIKRIPKHRNRKGR